MKKVLLILLIAAAAVSGCVGQGTAPSDNTTGIQATNNTVVATEAARLVLSHGIAELSMPTGEWRAAANNSALRSGDRVRTLDGAEAEIVFFDSTVIRLDANTELELKNASRKSVELYQPSGRTWSRVLKVAGIDDYEVRTPTAVAAVRGTAFSVDVDEDTVLFVEDGNVSVSSYEIEDDGDFVFLDEELIDEGFGVEVDFEDSFLEEITEEAILAGDAELAAWFEENILEDDVFIEDVTDEFFDEHPDIFDRELTAEQFAVLEDWMEGDADESDLVEAGIITQAELDEFDAAIEASIRKDIEADIEAAVRESIESSIAESFEGSGYDYADYGSIDYESVDYESAKSSYWNYSINESYEAAIRESIEESIKASIEEQYGNYSGNYTRNYTDDYSYG